VRNKISEFFILNCSGPADMQWGIYIDCTGPSYRKPVRSCLALAWITTFNHRCCYMLTSCVSMILITGEPYILNTFTLYLRTKWNSTIAAIYRCQLRGRLGWNIDHRIYCLVNFGSAHWAIYEALIRIKEKAKVWQDLCHFTSVLLTRPRVTRVHWQVKSQEKNWA
jgi:hypothetical protein